MEGYPCDRSSVMGSSVWKMILKTGGKDGRGELNPTFWVDGWKGFCGKLPSQGLPDANVPSPLLIHIGFEGLKYLKYLKYLGSPAATCPVPSAGGAWGSWY